MLAHGEVLEEARLVREEGQLALGLHRVRGEQVPRDAHLPRGGREDAREAAQRGGLPCPVGPHQAQHLAGRHAEAQVLHGPQLAVGLAQPLHGEQGSEAVIDVHEAFTGA